MSSRRFDRSSEKTAPLSGQRPGFVMVALMVAVVLLATGVMAIGAANTSRIRAQTTATAKGAALSVARQHLENLRGRDPWSIASESGVRVNAAGAVAAYGEFTRSVQVTVDRQNLITIEVSVTGPRLEQPIKLITNAYRGGTMTPRA